jgi:hypothetical protein
VIAPHGKGNKRREILIGEQSERDKLPPNEYPITVTATPEGIGVTLISGPYECEASFHRYENPSVMYIGSATRRLGPRKYARLFREFLERCDVLDHGTTVGLKFDASTVHLERIE